MNRHISTFMSSSRRASPTHRTFRHPMHCARVGPPQKMNSGRLEESCLEELAYSLLLLLHLQVWKKSRLLTAAFGMSACRWMLQKHKKAAVSRPCSMAVRSLCTSCAGVRCCNRVLKLSRPQLPPNSHLQLPINRGGQGRSIPQAANP